MPNKPPQSKDDWRAKRVWVETVLDDLSEDEKDMIFRRTAAGIYRIALADRTTPADGSWQVVAE